jgi:chaperonin cofactor prefoldin
VTPSTLRQQPNLVLDLAIEELLDASSLHTVLTMLEVIDSLDDLALLETLTPAQKRQVWDATPESTKVRLIQLRAAQSENATQPAAETATKAAAETAPLNQQLTALVNSTELLQEELSGVEEAAIELEALEEIDLGLAESLSKSLERSAQTAPVSVSVGDWVVLQAQPNLSNSELMAIWQVVEVRGSSARISTEKLGIRNYPISWMVNYPKPVEPEF